MSRVKRAILNQGHMVGTYVSAWFVAMYRHRPATLVHTICAREHKNHETGLLASPNKLVVPTGITLVKASTFN